MTSTFSHRIPLARLSRQGVPVRLSATPEQCAALADRFGLAALDRLDAELLVRRMADDADATARRTADGAEATGRLSGAVVQHCVVSHAPVPATIDQPITLRFAPPPPADASEIELDADDADTILIEDDAIDLAEAVAQSLLLALDPYPRADDATLAACRRLLLSEEEAAARAAGEQAAANPFSALKRPG